MSSGRDSIAQASDRLLPCTKSHPTPFYLFDEDAAASSCMRMVSAFSSHGVPARFFFPYKTNSVPAFLRLVHGYGIGAEVSSPLELELASMLKAPGRVYSSPGKTAADVAYAAGESATILVNSRDDLPKIEAALDSPGEGSKIGIRLSLGRPNAEWSRFGVRPEDVGAVVDEMEGLGIRLSGVQFHLGSWLSSPAPYVTAIRAVGRMLSGGPLRHAAAGLEFVDVGGGIGVRGSAHKGALDYARGLMAKHGVGHRLPKAAPRFDFASDSLDSFAQAICGSFKREILPSSPGAGLWLEPGRLLAAPSFHLVVSVLAVRDSGLVVDGGINLLPNALNEKYAVLNLSKPAGRYREADVWGPLPMSNDRLADGVFGGEPEVGDVLCVMGVGAYNLSMSPQFAAPQAAVVSLKGGEARLVRRREDLSYRMGRDVAP